MNFSFKDCYCNFDGQSLVVGNSLIEERVKLFDGIPCCEGILDKSSGKELFSHVNKPMALCNIPGFDFSDAEVSADASVFNYDGLSEEQLCVTLSFCAKNAILKLFFCVFPDNRFISCRISVKGKLLTSDGGAERADDAADGIETAKKAEKKSANENVNFPSVGAICAFPLTDMHIKTKSVEFSDVTDKNNSLVLESNDLVYVRKSKCLQGQMFLLDFYTDNKALLLVKDAPSAAGRLKVNDYDVSVAPSYCVEMLGSVDFDSLPEDEENELYYCTFALGEASMLFREYKDFYRRSNLKIKNDGLIRMSNTWGDRNQDAAVKENFVLCEIENASRLGVNVLQIDDGWQKGASANSKLVQSNVWGRGYYDSDKDFWTTHREKFPNGFSEITKKLEENNIRFALWFSPDLANDYENWQKDAETLLGLYREHGVVYFKLDGINIRSQREENNLLKMLRYVSRGSNNAVSFNFDITAGRRWGYIYRKEFGNVFIENRYTDWGNYYPHYTLRSLWQLSKYLPLARFQAEFLNLRRNIEKYGADNAFAPNNYSMDYAFAVTMFACPLYWFELQNLTDPDKARLSAIAKVHSEHSMALAMADVTPVGDEPDGMSFTGFKAECDDGHGYLLLFRENTEKGEYLFKCDLPDGAEFKMLYLSDEGISIKKVDGGVLFSSPSARSFAFVSY